MYLNHFIKIIHASWYNSLSAENLRSTQCFVNSIKHSQLKYDSVFENLLINLRSAYFTRVTYIITVKVYMFKYQNKKSSLILKRKIIFCWSIRKDRETIKDNCIVASYETALDFWPFFIRNVKEFMLKQSLAKWI